MNRISYYVASVLAIAALSGCVVQPIDASYDVLSPTGETSSSGDPGYEPPPPRLNCPDETGSIESDTDINAGSSSLSTFTTAGAWIAWKYAPEFNHAIGKVCIASKPLTVPTRIYLLADAGNAPGSVLKGGDLYNTMPGYACTLDAPFDFTASVVGGDKFWFASDAAAPLVATDGNRIPFWKGSSDPQYTDPTWSEGCSAGFVAHLNMLR